MGRCQEVRRFVPLAVATVLIVLAAPVQAEALDSHDLTDPVALCNWAGATVEELTGDGWMCAEPSEGDLYDLVEGADATADEIEATVGGFLAEHVFTDHDVVDETSVATPDGGTAAASVCADDELLQADARPDQGQGALSLPAPQAQTAADAEVPVTGDHPCTGADLSWLDSYYGELIGTADVDVERCAVTFTVSSSVHTGTVRAETRAVGGDEAGPDCFTSHAAVARVTGEAIPDADERTRYAVAPEPRRRLAERTDDAAASGLTVPVRSVAAATSAGPGDPVADPGAHRLVLAVSGLLASSLVAVRLYRRLRRDELLDNDLRRRMVDLVRAEPAIHASELARRLDVAVTTVLYHGRILAEADLMVLRRAQGEVVFLDRAAGADAVEREALCVLRSDAKRRVVEALLDAPGANMAEIARRVDRARNTVKHHVDDLLAAGLVEDRSATRTRELVVPDEARTVLRRHL